MSKVVCIFDACTVINLIYIDNDESLVKKLKYLDIRIPEKVFDEVRKNAFGKVETVSFNSSSEKEIFLKNIEDKIGLFRSYQTFNSIIKKDLGDSFFEEVKNYASYSKENGEFFSIALGLYLSRLEEIKLSFYTDDYPAKDRFESFFKYQQIGFIEDSVDLLLLIYRLDPDFRESDLDNYLSALFYEYASQAKELVNRLNSFLYNLPSNFVKDKFIKDNIRKLIYEINNLTFSGINQIRGQIASSKKYKSILKILELYPSVFEMETTSNDNYLSKIKTYRQELKNKPIYKVY